MSFVLPKFDPERSTRAESWRRLVAVLLGLLLADGALAWAGVIPPPRFAQGVLIGAAFAGGFRLHLSTRPKRLELIATLLVGAALFALTAARPLTRLVAAGLMASGAASAIVLAVRCALARRAERRRCADNLALVLLLPLLVLVAQAALSLTGLHLATYDGAAFHIDAMFGGQPSFALGRLFHDHQELHAFCGAAYGLLPLAMAILYVAEKRSAGPVRARILDAVVLAGIAGFVLYNVCPVCGPLYRFGATFPFGKPSHVPFVSSLPSRYFRNGVPSLHTAWVLLLYWHARRCGTDVRVFAGVWLVLTELATLGLGEHYLIDLAVAVPFAVAVEAAVTSVHSSWWPAQRDALIAGSGLTLASLLLMRWAPRLLASSSAVTWTFAVVIVLVPIALHERMARRVDSEASLREAEVTAGA